MNGKRLVISCVVVIVSHLLIAGSGMLSSRREVAFANRSMADYLASNSKGISGLLWQTTPVDFDNQGMHVSLALDQSGYPHLSYCQFDTFFYFCSELRYAYLDGLDWITQTITNSLGSGAYTSLAIDASGNPHISYHDAGNGWLKYAHHDGLSWQIETVEGEFNDFTGLYSSLALDDSGFPYISYYNAVEQAVEYAHYDGSSWQIETVETAFSEILDTSLVLDIEDNPHIAYIIQGDWETQGGDVKWAYKASGIWTISTLPPEAVESRRP